MSLNSLFKPAYVIALVAALGAVLSLTALWIASGKASGTQGLRAVASDGEDGIYLLIAETLYRVDLEGLVTEKMTLEELGLPVEIADLVTLGTDLVLVAGSTGDLYRCNPQSRGCRIIGKAPGKHGGRAFDLMVDPGNDRLFISNSRHHRIDVVSTDGSHLSVLQGAFRLRYPNGMAYLGDERIVIADTNNHRLLGLRVSGESDAEVLWSVDAANQHGRTDRRWPITVALSSEGNLWAINGDGSLTQGDLIVYDPTGQAERRIHLEPGSDPVFLLPLPDGMLVGDYDNFRLIRVSLSGDTLSSFGDASLKQALTRLKQAQNTFDRSVTLAYVSLCFFLFLGLAAGYLDWRQRRSGSKRSDLDPEVRSVSIKNRHPYSARESVEGYQESIWLRPSERFRKQLRLVGLLLAGLFVVGLCLFLLVSDPPRAPWVLLTGLLAVIPAGVLYAMFRRIREVAIHIEQGRVTLMDMSGRRTTVKPEALIYTRNRLIAGNIAVPLRSNHGEIFEAEAIERHLLPLLTSEQQTSEFGYLTRKLGTGDPKTWLGLVAVLIMLIAVFWLEH